MEKRKPDFVGLDEEKSFARHTMENRFPLIIDGIPASRPAGDPTTRALAELKREIREDVVRDPFDDEVDFSLFQPEEIAAWREEIGPRLGLPWRKLPFYFAEAYMYLRILLASGYYDRRSPYFGVDPFEGSKTGELSRFLSAPESRSAVGAFRELGMAARDGGSRADAAEALEGAVLFMLKGNRIDLSNARIAEHGRKLMHDGGRGDLLVDQLDLLGRLLRNAKRVDLILDNAGAELAADLVFVWCFLSAFPDARIVVHAKRAPTFVSDAMMKDLDHTVEAFASGPFPEIGRGLYSFRESARLQVRDHFFWNGPKHFTFFPREIAADLSGSDLIIVKGDANFRRIVEDRKWPYETPLDEIAAGFPGVFAVLRTLKSEVAADIPRDLAERLTREDPAWLVDGRWGVIRVVGNGRRKGE